MFNFRNWEICKYNFLPHACMHVWKENFRCDHGKWCFLKWENAKLCLECLWKFCNFTEVKFTSVLKYFNLIWGEKDTFRILHSNFATWKNPYCKWRLETNLANLRWPTRPQPKGSHYFHAWCPPWSVSNKIRVFCFPGLNVCAVAFCDGRTDTMCENNDHLFGRGLLGQWTYDVLKKTNLLQWLL